MNTNFNSSEYYYQAIKFLFPLISVLLTIFGLVLIFLKIDITVGEITEPASFSNLYELFIFSGIILIITLSIRNKIAYVEFRRDKTTITSVNGQHEIDNKNIKSINQIQFVYPPLYLLKIRNSNKSYLFIIYKEYVKFNGFVKDTSIDRDRLDELKNQHNI